jgi:hypothetical protein
MASVDREGRPAPAPAQPGDDVAPEDTIPALPVPLVIGVTGHRDLLPEELPLLEARVREFFENLRESYPSLPLEVLSPLAEGADRLVARVALELGIRVIVLLPMQRDLYFEDFEEPQSRAEFDALVEHEQALEFELPEMPGPSAPSDRGTARELQYARLGVFIASHCHILLALWDGMSSSQVGGTAQVIEFHQRDYMPGISEQRREPSLNLINDESDLVYHLTCSRRRHPEPLARAGESSWLTLDETNPRTSELPERYRRVFTRIAEFNADALVHREAIERESWSLSSEGDPIPQGARRIEQAFKVADGLAIIFQRRYFQAIRTMLGVAAAAGFCFVAFADLPDQDVMIYPYLGLFVIGIAVFYLEQRGAWHRRSLDYRALAESLRIEFYWAVAGVATPTPTKYNHDSYLSKQDVELGWIRHVLRFTSRRANAQLDVPEHAGVDFVIDRWIGEQRDYFGSRAPRHAANHERNALIGLFCFWAGIVIAVILALVQFWISDAVKTPLMALMGLLPLITAGVAVYSHKKADMENIKQYRFMHRIMTEALRRLRDAASDDDRRGILRALGQTALDEQAQWLMRQRERRPDSQELA